MKYHKSKGLRVDKKRKKTKSPFEKFGGNPDSGLEVKDVKSRPEESENELSPTCVRSYDEGLGHEIFTKNQFNQERKNPLSKWKKTRMTPTCLSSSKSAFHFK